MPEKKEEKKEEKKADEKKVPKLSGFKSEDIYVHPDGKPTGKFMVVYQDVFHFKSLYVTMYDWLIENGWTSAEPWEGGKGDDKPETLFYDNRSPGNLKIWIWWRLQKGTENPYYHYYLNVEFMMLGMRDVEGVNRQGTKFTGQLGELSIFIRPWIRLDPSGAWWKNPFLRPFLPFFRKRVLVQDLLEREDLLLKDTYRFIGVVKKFLEQHTFIPETEILFEPRRKYV
jgi:hypothetical protein